MSGDPAGSVAEVVADHLLAEPPGPSVTAAIHGSLEPDAIASQIEGVLASLERPQPVAGCLFHGASVGSVTGVVLADGTRLVVKAYQPAWRPDFLRGVLATQDRLWRAGVPCPEPVGGPSRCGLGFATVEHHLPDPGQPEAFGDDEQRASAEGLALVIEQAGLDERLVRHPLRQPSSGLYPRPHSPLFEFEATAAGAEWIDRLAELAKANRLETPTVIAHTDWSARNVRLRASGVVAFYDLDSLAAVSLSTAVGHAAVTWRARGEAGEPVAPGLDEIDEWLDRFPTALSTADRRAALAAALGSLCYTARCEHAIDPAGQRHVRARQRLRQDGTAFERALGHR